MEDGYQGTVGSRNQDQYFSGRSESPVLLKGQVYSRLKTSLGIYGQEEFCSLTSILKEERGLEPYHSRLRDEWDRRVIGS